MSTQFSIISRLALATVLAIWVALPGLTWAENGLVKTNPAQSADETLGQARSMNMKLHVVYKQIGNGRCDEPSLELNQFPGPQRFVTVLNGGAYCDQKTGIVWERSPTGGFSDWAGAVSHCATLQLGGYKGWALPMREQLASLLDVNSILCLGGGLCLPDGHPFQNIHSAGYWTASTTSGTPTFGWLVNFSFGSALVMKLDTKGLAWCVRTGQSTEE